MNKQKIGLLIPLLMIASRLIYCWSVILFSDTLATWRHYIGLLLFIVVVILVLRSFAKAVFATGIFLLLATFNLLAITPEISTSWMRFGAHKSVSTPHIQLMSLALLGLYFILNIDTLIEIQLDYREAKQQKDQILP